MYNNYLFDLDGTLLASIDLILKCFEHSLSYAGLKTIDYNEIKGHIGLPLKRQFEIYLSELDQANIENIMREHMSYQLSHWKDHLFLYEGTRSVLETLKQRGKKLAIVTSRRRQTTDVYLKHFELDSFFDTVVTPDDTDSHKPEPGPALTALEKIKGKADESLFVGDADFDIECGNRAGTDTCLIIHDRSKIFKSSSQPDFMIYKLTDLIKNF